MATALVLLPPPPAPVPIETEFSRAWLPQPTAIARRPMAVAWPAAVPPMLLHSVLAGELAMLPELPPGRVPPPLPTSAQAAPDMPTRPAANSAAHSSDGRSTPDRPPPTTPVLSLLASSDATTSWPSSLFQTFR